MSSFSVELPKAEQSSVPELEGSTDVTPREFVPIKEKMAYGAGAVTNQFGEGGINALATPVYNITMGLNPATIGFILGGIRLWDAITDPISDNWKGSSGRRKPFMLMGAILMAVTYPPRLVLFSGLERKC